MHNFYGTSIKEIQNWQLSLHRVKTVKLTHLILSPTRSPEPPVRGLVGVWVSLGLVVLFILWDINNLAPADLIRFQNVVIICDGCMTSTKLYWIISKNGLSNAKFRNAKPPHPTWMRRRAVAAQINFRSFIKYLPHPRVQQLYSRSGRYFSLTVVSLSTPILMYLPIGHFPWHIIDN